MRAINKAKEHLQHDSGEMLLKKPLTAKVKKAIHPTKPKDTGTGSISRARHFRHDDLGYVDKDDPHTPISTTARKKKNPETAYSKAANASTKNSPRFRQ